MPFTVLGRSICCLALAACHCALQLGVHFHHFSVYNTAEEHSIAATSSAARCISAAAASWPRIMLHSRPRLAAGLHTGLHAFAWCMVVLWLAALFRLAVSDRINDNATERNLNIVYHYGNLYDGDKEKMSLFVGGAKTIVNMIGESAPGTQVRGLLTLSRHHRCILMLHGYVPCTGGSRMGRPATITRAHSSTSNRAASWHGPAVMNGQLTVPATYRRRSIKVLFDC